MIQIYVLTLEIPTVGEFSKTMMQPLKLARYGDDPIKEPY